jgi:hypothetical protein
MLVNSVQGALTKLDEARASLREIIGTEEKEERT